MRRMAFFISEDLDAGLKTLKEEYGTPDLASWQCQDGASTVQRTQRLSRPMYLLTFSVL